MPRGLLRRLLVLVLAGFAVGLTGCAAGPASAPSPSAAGEPDAAARTSTPTPEPTLSAESTARIVIGPESLELQGADGAVVATLPYTLSAAEFTAQLGMALDGEPRVEDQAAGPESPERTRYVWDGLEVWDPAGTGDSAELRYVRATAAEAGAGVALQTRDRFQVGDPIDEIRAQVGIEGEFGGTFVGVDFGPSLGEPVNDMYPNAFAVTVGARTADGPVEFIGAPVHLGVPSV